MKKHYTTLTLIILFLTTSVFAQQKTDSIPEQKQEIVTPEPKQEKEDEISVKLGGFVRFESFFDTYNSVTARDGVVYLYPSPEKLDSLGNDINATNQLGMASFVSRFKFAISGPQILGAKSSGLIEADFYATQNDYVQMLRLRHAYIKLDWGKVNFLAGQAFHPMFVTKCFPRVLTYAVAVPYGTLNRSPQLRLTLTPNKWFTVLGAAMIHGYHKSKGPGDAQRNSGIPDMQLQVMLSPGNFFAGVTGGYKVLQPRLSTDDGVKTDEKIGSYNLQAFAGYETSMFSVKAMGVFGENLTHLTMLGGYGASEDPNLVDNYGYSNLQTYAAWLDITVLKNPQIGIFGGVSGNVGSRKPYYSLNYDRSEEMVLTFRASPRVTYKVKNFTLGLEYLLAGSLYGETFDINYKATSVASPTLNNRVTFLMTYTF